MGEAVKKLGYYAGGEWKTSKTSNYTKAYNPSTGEVIAMVPCCLPEEVEEDRKSTRLNSSHDLAGQRLR